MTKQYKFTYNLNGEQFTATVLEEQGPIQFCYLGSTETAIPAVVQEFTDKFPDWCFTVTGDSSDNWDRTYLTHLITEDLTRKLQEGESWDCLAVTNVQVYPFRDEPSLGHIKAVATVVLNDQFMIRGLRVMDGENGLFVSYPVDPFYKGECYRSVCNPVTRQLREHIENCVLEKYQACIQ